jgi:hypothetical protein
MTVDRIIVSVNLRNDKPTSGVVFAIKPRTRRTLVTYLITSVPSVRKVGTCLISVHNIDNPNNNNNNVAFRRIVPYVTNTVMWANIARNGKTEIHVEKVIRHQQEELQDDLQ